MESFVKRLTANIKRKKSHVVAGLDPRPDIFPQSIMKSRKPCLRDTGLAIFEFNRAVIDAVHDLIPAVKPQIAFYERYGIHGIEAFMKTVAYAREKGLVVIDDAKRNDIGSTARAYSDAHLGRVTIDHEETPVFDADALTVTPYLGSDGIAPFIRDCRRYAKGIFVLVRTSNPSSAELQDLPVMHDGTHVKFHEVVAKLVRSLGKDLVDETGYSPVGAVVGATCPREAATLRQLMPESYLLVPGYGAQGGTARDIVDCFNSDGTGALISSSRGINYAYLNSKRYSERDFDKAARDAVREMNEDINSALGRKGISGW